MFFFLKSYLFQVNEADYYPKYVCKGCLDELKIAFHFKRKCEASDMMFRKTILSETLICMYSCIIL